MGKNSNEKTNIRLMTFEKKKFVMYPIPNSQKNHNFGPCHRKIAYKSRENFVSSEEKQQHTKKYKTNWRQRRNIQSRKKRAPKKEKQLSNIEMDTHRFNSNIRSHQILCWRFLLFFLKKSSCHRNSLLTRIQSLIVFLEMVVRMKTKKLLQSFC